MTPPLTAAAVSPPAAAASRSLRRLALTDFRSHAATTLEVASLEAASGAALIALTGGNGAGKTGILEAISLLAPGRGMHGVPFRDLARRDGPGGWSITADITTDDLPCAITTTLPPPADSDPADPTGGPTGGRSGKSGRIARIDQKTVSPGALAQLLRVVWLTPAMDRLFSDSAAARRRFLDRMVLAFQPDHAADSLAYDRAMRARNRLLESGGSGQWLDTLETAMARHGLRMAHHRADVTARLDAALQQAPCDAFPPARLSLSGFSAEVDEEHFRTILRNGRDRDTRAGRALEGAHVCDLEAIHAEHALPARACSAGEQKALLISILLAHARLMGESGVPPLLLLDDVTAHLDASRRTALFAALARLDVQVWMSGTDRDWFKTPDNAPDAMQLFHVSRDRVTPL